MHSNIPSSSGYQALIQDKPKFTTNIAPLPIIPHPVSDWGTVYTALKLAQGISVDVLGPNRKTTITLDLALYEKAVQLTGSRPDLQNKFNLRLGELHVVKAHLLCLGSFILDSGYESVWNEAGVYGPTTTKAILNASHIKRALQAHEDNLIALTQLMLEELYTESPHLKKEIRELGADFTCDDVEKCQEIHEALKTLHLAACIDKFIESREGNANARFAVKYMEMIKRGQTYIFASRNRDWLGHLAASDELCMDLFSQDRIKYMRMMPFYIRSQYALQYSDPETWHALEAGDFCVTKSDIPFVSLGVDHAGEQENKVLKSDGGLIGIANNANARERYCITAPIISRMVTELNEHMSSASNPQKTHHQLIPSERKKQAERVEKIKSAIKSHTNPFGMIQDPSLSNLVTNKVVAPEFIEGILNVDKQGKTLHQDFINERLETQSTKLWARMKRNSLPSFAKPDPNCKRSLESICEVDLKTERDLLSRFLIISRSSREFDEREAVGNYELATHPKSLFQGDKLLYCTDKSDVARELYGASQNSFHHLANQLEITEEEKDDEWDEGSETFSMESQETQSSGVGNSQPDEGDLAINGTENLCMSSPPYVPRKCLVIDGMAVLHLMTNTRNITNMSSLSTAFNARIGEKIQLYDEVRLVFDPYPEGSRKQTTREKRKKGAEATYYSVNESTNISGISMTQFLSHEKTKQEVTVFLAKQFIEAYKESKTIYVTSYRNHPVYTSFTYSNCDGEVKQVDDLRMNHDEADTMLVTNAVHFSNQTQRNGILHVWSPDTDVLLLFIYYMPHLPRDTFLFWQQKTYDIFGLYSHIGQQKVKGLMGWHALTGSDTTGKFARRGKMTWWHLFIDLDEKDDNDIISAFQEFGRTPDVACQTEKALSRFVTLAYAKGTDSLPAARWHLFSKKLAAGDKLPPTPSSFKQHVLRALVQAFAWRHSHQPEIPMLPVHNGFYGWRYDKNEWKPIPSGAAAAPSVLLELVKCNCGGTCETRACSCSREGLPCTEMCHISGEIFCENTDPKRSCAADSDEEGDEESCF